MRRNSITGEADGGGSSGEEGCKACTHCGKLVPASYHYCTSCGANMDAQGSPIWLPVPSPSSSQGGHRPPSRRFSREPAEFNDMGTAGAARQIVASVPESGRCPARPPYSGYPLVPVIKKKTEDLAVVSLICAVASFVFFPVLPAIVAVAL
ncbi:MAG: hypothetical protein SWK76_11090, partial [Actinomycetota bacterium]|nr:hypothetical protein [Actinomycetota bacterium]